MSTTRAERPSKHARLQPDVRRRQILDTALEVFAARGYGASLGDIGDAAGITRPALYHYFPSKADLWAAVVERQITEAMRYVVPAATSAGSDRRRMRAGIEALLIFSEERPESVQLLFHALEENDPEALTVRTAVRDDTLAALSALMPEEASALGIAPDSTHARAITEMTLGALVAVIRWWYREPHIPRDEILDAAEETIWKGLGGVIAAGHRRQARAQREPSAQ